MKIDEVALVTLPALSVAVTVSALGPTASKLIVVLQVPPVIVRVPTCACAVLTLTTGIIPASTVPERRKSSPLIGAVIGVMVSAGNVVSRVTAVVAVVTIVLTV